MQANKHALQISGPETGHVVRDVAFFDEAWRAAEVVRVLKSHHDLLEALEHAIVDVGCVADRLALGSPMRNTLEGFVIEARAAIAKATGT